LSNPDGQLRPIQLRSLRDAIQVAPVDFENQLIATFAAGHDEVPLAGKAAQFRRFAQPKILKKGGAINCRWTQ
jgi:hypothetical protein